MDSVEGNSVHQLAFVAFNTARRSNNQQWCILRRGHWRGTHLDVETHAHLKRVPNAAKAEYFFQMREECKHPGSEDLKCDVGSTGSALTREKFVGDLGPVGVRGQ